MRPRRRRILLASLALVGGSPVVALLGGYGWLSRSLAILDGEIVVPGIASEVTIARDDAGVPTIEGQSRTDVAFALGFLHGQERFFQMDLLRRRAAGELAELVGEAVVGMDRTVRVHRFRARARDVVRARPSPVLDAYVAGVNEGLGALAAHPFEYAVLRSAPAPWTAEDSLLCVYAMYLELQADTWRRESMNGLVHDLVPGPMYEFLLPRGTEWDAPLQGDPVAPVPVPGPDVVDLRRQAPAQASVGSASGEPFAAGSNNWVVAGAHTVHGGAIVANDMHLPISVPNIWYRVSLRYRDGMERRTVAGVSLPGTPAVTVGSNGNVAWGFTNAQVDVADLVVLEPAGEGYLAPGGPRPFSRATEIVHVKGGADVPVEVLETIWGPVVDEDHRGRRRALAWVAHHPLAVNLGLLEMERATTVEEAFAAAHAAGVPAQNLVLGERSGRIGWTIIGPLPRRTGHDGRLPVSWATGAASWEGLLAPGSYPRIVDPEAGRLWTANARTVDGEMLAVLGDGGYMLGSRAQQIRDRLTELPRATERDMLAIQLEDRAALLERWRHLLLEVAGDGGDDPRLRTAVGLVRSWSGRAAVDDAGYRIVRSFRWRVADDVLGPLTAPLRSADPEFDFWRNHQLEGPLFALVHQRPAHLLPAGRDSWREQLLVSLRAVLEELARLGPLPERTWGERNRAAIRHPLSPFLPLVGRWLDMPPDPLPGDSHIPRFQSPDAGASERMVVSPGREELGIFHMPCGQSGHPLSPSYRDGHAAWVSGAPTPFLPGPVAHTLRLVPR